MSDQSKKRNLSSQVYWALLLLLSSFLIVSCKDPVSPPPNIRLKLNTCLSPEEGACQSSLYSARSTTGHAACLQLSIDDVLVERLPLQWNNQGRLELSQEPSAEIESGQRVRATLIFTDSIAALSCETSPNYIGQRCGEIQSCMLKLDSPELRFESQELTIDFLDGRDICLLDYVEASLPSEREGDLLDNDCDGQVDEVILDSCTIGRGECESRGQIRVGSDGVSYCDAILIEPQLERCGDRLDSDCDGRANNGFEILGEPCEAVEGKPATGVFVCDANQPTVPFCRRLSSTDYEESCNGIDDNENGIIDEGLEATEVDCQQEMSQSATSMCDHTGIQFCESGTIVNTCLDEPIRFQNEVILDEAENPSFLCDGFDNDCNGNTDEDFIPEAIDCPNVNCGLLFGRTECLLGQVVERCEPVPQAEDCDGYDNDCDGQIDEITLTDLNHCGACGQVCSDQYPNSVLECVDGQCRELSCFEGFGDGSAPGLCDCPLIPPSQLTPNAARGCCQDTELRCNQLDDDCDGQIDEGTASCNCDDLESCSPEDNDCDGYIDESNVSGSTIGVCGSAITNACELSVSHTRQFNGQTAFVVSEGVGYSMASNGEFIPLTNVTEVNTLHPVYFVNADGADRVQPQLNCSALDGWEVWVEDHCRMTFIWGSRAGIDPWDCTDSSQRGFSTHCNHSASSITQPIDQSYNELHVAFTCKASETSLDGPRLEQQRVLRAISSFNLRIAMIQNLVNGNSRCAPLSSQPSISQQACLAGSYQGRPLICGGIFQDVSADQNTITKWSSISFANGVSPFLQRCNQLLFSR